MPRPHSIDGELHLAPGQVLAGRYSIEQELGSGAMGTVYRALDRRTNLRLAIKGLTRPAPDLLMYFKREYRELADVRHPNLARLGELFEAEGRVYFTMELVDGVDFLSWVRPRGRLDLARLRNGLRQLAGGLTALHAANLLHRDLKPENVLVDQAGRVVILDFGLATRLEDGRQRDDVLVVGTAAYMAPEQGGGEPLGPRADWYAVGVLLYEALVGELPFDGSPVEILTAKLTADARDPSVRRPELPADLVALCRALLSRRPTARPTGPEVLRQLGDSADPPPPRAIVPVGFVGRRQELDALSTAMSDARRWPVLQLVVGESGVGKTALVQAFLAPLRDDERLILPGRCHERETLAFKAFDGIADVLARRLAGWPREDVEAVLPPDRELLGALFPSLDQVPAIAATRAAGVALVSALDQREQRRRAFAAFAGLIRNLAARRRVILFIDDLQRADPDSLDLLAAVMAGGDGPAPLLIGTARPSELVERVIAMGAAGELVAPRVLRLGPLEAGPARELARLVLARAVGTMGAAAQAPVASIVAESRCHPGFILELTRAALESSRHAGSLDAVIMARVERLPAAQRGVLEVLAVAEAPLTLAVLAAARAADPDALQVELDALREAELITMSGRGPDDWIETYHDRVADAVRDSLVGERLSAVHLALAQALDGAGAGDPERVLSHYLAADEHGPVLRLAIDAARRAAASLEHRRTVRLCLLALRHGPAPDDGEALHRSAGAALAAIGDLPEAAEHYLAAAKQAAARGDRDASREARRLAADQLLLSGAVDRGVEVLDEVLRELGMGLARSRPLAVARAAWHRVRRRVRGTAPSRRPVAMTPGFLARLEGSRSAALGLAMVDTLRGAEYQARFVNLALSSGDRGLVARGLAFEATYHAARGPHAAARVRALLDEAAGLAVTDFDQGWVDLAAAMAYLLLRDLGRGLAAAERAVAAFVGRAGAGVWEQRNARLYAMRHRWWSGRLDELRTCVHADVADARRHGDHYSLVQLLAGVGSNVWLADDDLATFWANVEEARALWSAPSYQLPDFYRLGSVIHGHGYAGDGATAWREVEAAWPALARSGILRIEFLASQAWLMRGGAAAAAALGATDRGRLHAEVERCASRLAAMSTPFARGSAAGLRGALASQRDDRGGAEAALRRAQAEFVLGDMPVYAAAARRHADALAGNAGAADGELRAQGVRAPARFAATLVPGVRG